MKISSLLVLLIMNLGATGLALGQDVQGMSSGTTGKAAVSEPKGNSRERLRGEVVSVDLSSGRISIKLSGDVGLNDSTAPTAFKVQDGLILNAIKRGDKVSFNADNVRGK